MAGTGYPQWLDTYSDPAGAKRSYMSWGRMKQRCHNPKDDVYCDYGGRGIYVCKEWRDSFEQFLTDMGPRPEGMTLDREDNDGPYCKDNCKWSTYKEQNQNRRPRSVISQRKNRKLV